MVEAITGEVRKPRWLQTSMVLGPPMPWVALWLASGLLLNASQLWLFQALWIGATLFVMAHALWGIRLAALFQLEVLKKSDRQFVPAFYATLVLLPALALLSVSPVLRDIADRVVFTVRKAEYDRVVADVATGVSPAPLSWSSDNGIEGCSFSSASPDLIVFRWFNGIPDGGFAIVYDRSGAVERIGSADWSMTPNLEHLLAGQPESCDRYAGPHYFMCYFS